MKRWPLFALAFVVGVLIGLAQCEARPLVADSPLTKRLYIPAAPVSKWTPTPTPTPKAPSVAVHWGAGNTYRDSNIAINNLFSGIPGAWQHGWTRDPATYPETLDIARLYSKHDVCKRVNGQDWRPGQPCQCSTVGGEGQWLLGVNEPNYEAQNNYVDPVTMAHLLYQGKQCHPSRWHLGPGTDDLDYLADVLDHYIAIFGTEAPLHGLSGHCYGDYMLPMSIGKCKGFVDNLAELAIAHGYSVVFFDEWAYTGASESESIQFMQQVGAHMASLPQRKAGIDEVWIGWFQLRFQRPVNWWWWPADPQLATWETQQLTLLGVAYRGMMQ